MGIVYSKFKTASYMGGPEPELPFEPRWWKNYAEVLKSAAMAADPIFMQNILISSDHRGTVTASSDVVFMKVPIKN